MLITMQAMLLFTFEYLHNQWLNQDSQYAFLNDLVFLCSHPTSSAVFQYLRLVKEHGCDLEIKDLFNSDLLSTAVI